jgi:hypothetical protein
MGEPLTLRNLAWALTTLLEFALFYYLVRRRLYRSHPAFFVYVLAVIAQSIFVAFVYHRWNPRGLTAWSIAWGSQAVIICARWFAITGIARKILAVYSGIWRMTRVILVLLSVCVLAFALLTSRNQWDLFVLNADRAVELCVGTFIVAMFIFVRYYRLVVPNLERLLAIGFCLYSCFYVINDSVYESWHTSFGAMWSFLDTLTFLASLVLWLKVVRGPTEALPAKSGIQLSPEEYGQLSRQLDSRLLLLDSRLNHLLRSEGPRS